MNKLMLNQTLPFPLPYWLWSLINFFAADDGAGEGSDKTDDKNGDDDTFVDDLDKEFGEDDDDDGTFDDKKDDKKEDKKDDKDDKSDKSDKDKKDDKSSKPRSSAIIQKQKYREQLRDARAKIAELEGKKADGRSLSEEEKKEQAANEFLVTKIKEVLGGIKEEEAKANESEEEAFQEELDDVLESDDNFTEEQLLDVCEEYDVPPKTALKILKDREKYKGKPKPVMPKSNKGSGKVEDTKSKDPNKPKTLDDVNREAKDKIRQGLL